MTCSYFKPGKVIDPGLPPVLVGYTDFSAFCASMVLVVNAKGLLWDGDGWASQGRVFLSEASATRSLHENGEDPEKTLFVQDYREDNAT
jgi:hypothetical protein